MSSQSAFPNRFAQLPRIKNNTSLKHILLIIYVVLTRHSKRKLNSLAQIEFYEANMSVTTTKTYYLFVYRKIQTREKKKNSYYNYSRLQHTIDFKPRQFCVLFLKFHCTIDFYFVHSLLLLTISQIRVELLFYFCFFFKFSNATLTSRATEQQHNKEQQ